MPPKPQDQHLVQVVPMAEGDWIATAGVRVNIPWPGGFVATTSTAFNPGTGQSFIAYPYGSGTPDPGCGQVQGLAGYVWQGFAQDSWADTCYSGGGGCCWASPTINWAPYFSINGDNGGAVGLPEPYTDQGYSLSSPTPPDPGVTALTDGIRTELQLHPELYQTLIKWIDHEADPTNPLYPDPTVSTVTVPSCDGDTSYSDCATQLDGAQLTTHHQVILDLDHAHTSLPPDVVISTDPAAGASVPSTTDVAVTTNPRASDMPITVPDCTGLTYDPCVQLFRDAGATGSFTRQFATFDGADLTKPAGTVLQLSAPSPGQRMRTADDVTITTNPLSADMPVAVPAPMPDEQYANYAARLTALQLQPIRQDVNESDFFYYPDTVLSAPDRTLQTAPVPVNTNPPGTDNDTTGSQCRRSASFTEPNTTIDPYTVKQSFSALNLPDVPLRWGRYDAATNRGNFGYRKIAAKHGWSLADQTDTTKALTTPDVYYQEKDTQGNPITTWRYYYWYKVKSVWCTRKVVVQTRLLSNFDGRPMGIITSFAIDGKTSTV
jgi:hypothetical protein